METKAGPIFDEAQYRTDVLHHPSPESEAAQAQHLAEEAEQLGLKLPEIEASALLAASIPSEMVDPSSPVLSSGSWTDRNSVCGSVTPSHEAPSPVPSVLDQIVSSLSDVTLASNNLKAGSTRSLASLSTRPTSFCSSEGRTGLLGHGYNDPFEANSHRHSILSVASADKKERRRNSLKSAIGKIHFRKRRTSSAVVLPSEGCMTVSTSDKVVEHVFFEPKPESNDAAHQGPPHATNEASLPRLEIPRFSKEDLQRSLDDPELSEMHERHQMEMKRHLEFQDAALSTLRRRHQTAISEKQSSNQRQEDEKREKNIQAIAQIEERQLAVEIEQQREFDRAKMNSSTRIKHMEGYLRNASPPSSPAGTLIRAERSERSSESFSESDSIPPARVFTREHMKQLEQQYHSHKSMDQLHDARIKVLRDRQELKLQEATARMEKELNEMCNRHSQDIATLQTEHEREEASLMQALDTKKTTLRHRWYLEEAVLRRHLEVRHGQSYGPLPLVAFTPNTPIAVVEHSPLQTSTPDTIHPSQDYVPL
ncbi:hypothetical protein Pdw03_5884 [Penicillium digitatum]|uniref:Uncharacterized protein n=3 Tax=Penicillium digitatum TaxID=36651 RepID=K9GWM6_PEND2|nr:hypothetical protein PDIP_09770 [Penicillium digitatum Pd1]EKV19013.1 hypothetical protein PDIG_05100 [Penicillium digitatum PHI26]EKV21151.1 hypothetical protein PDIP_09770 [Penicillium digitatum Pd1]KAG0154015.1 hypothetical protein PDIDSM_1394 [Penicillium digitatum]QQK48249.1 hypothetical protein Pdw03_5884 [Penicillium digitatum]